MSEFLIELDGCLYDNPEDVVVEFRKLTDEIERLRAALIQYGEHTDGCRRELASRGCHCGLFDAIDAAREGKDA